MGTARASTRQNCQLFWRQRYVGDLATTWQHANIGAKGDPGYQMRRQVELGDVDFVTGDYLAGEFLQCSMLHRSTSGSKLTE
jgi:hypothetical protein